MGSRKHIIYGFDIHLEELLQIYPYDKYHYLYDTNQIAKLNHPPNSEEFSKNIMLSDYWISWMNEIICKTQDIDLYEINEFYTFVNSSDNCIWYSLLIGIELETQNCQDIDKKIMDEFLELNPSFKLLQPKIYTIESTF
jgi:hypothetical protein